MAVHVEIDRDDDRDPRIAISYETREWGADEPYERGWIDEYGESMLPDEYDEEDGLTAVDLAVDRLKDVGSLEPSSWPSWTPGTWYAQADGDRDYATGDVETRSYFLRDFMPAEEREIYARLKRAGRI